MMNWKDYPQLFLNGKFTFKYKGMQVPNNSYTSLEFGDWDEKENAQAVLIADLDWNDGFNLDTYIEFNQCKLIARPISDMSDEEVKNCPTYKSNDITPIEEMRYRLWYWTYSTSTVELIPAIVQNYLLSIGVYPFNQENPKDVIWRSKDD